ncbi:NADP-dependent 3-hydroxy acid dehydrogenase YdfG [Roseovarius marisflavi]|uniref:NADP-dependent 3-hydroxy acid dehydrogenase YdfG n=1 Tax=Roseovarius marisflavi TaxID=1054996 RepID=A0A1M6WDR7_9RHOB|nr:SDR family NAD(P)-dependent oxidoreductase [Roseovarius marisflavi]SHK91818.1 NADP-dependent 3-hydroxy acid dehydrogenase YdfG [Roseovarius marisflavi]
MHIVITGANRGIGKALADSYRAAGHQVTGTARAPSGDLIALDVTDPTAHHAMAQQIADQPVDLLICNAGVYPDKHETLEDGYPASMWAQAFATNVTGVFLSVQTLLPRIKAAKAGKIAVISSQMASQTRAPGGSYIYRASKAAALNLGRNLAVDLAPEGIAVGIYHPGWVRTDMGGDAAAISVEEAAQGLVERFAELDLAGTGCFRTYDGQDHPF